MSLEHILTPPDELDLLLTVHGLKPACSVELLPSLAEQKIASEGFTLTTLNVDSLRHSWLEGVIQGNALPYHVEVQRFSSTQVEGDCLEGMQVQQQVTYHVGQTKRDLDKVLNAKTDEQLGCAYDYPFDAVYAFSRRIKEGIPNGLYVPHAKEQAMRAGVPIPSWLAFISHIPSQLDIVNNEVSITSARIGRWYERFTRERDPALARMLC